jgi:hypothetical protein
LFRIITGVMQYKGMKAGLELVGKRIDKAVKRAEQKAKKPKKPSAAQLVRQYKMLKGLPL